MNINDGQIDQRLRQVSPPADLVARLHAIAAETEPRSDDAAMDRRLKDVEAPTDLAARLRVIADDPDIEWDDIAVNRRLTEVETPQHLLEQLHQVPTDIEIEQSLLDATHLNQANPPDGIHERLHRVVAECALQEQFTTAPGTRAAVSRLHRIPVEGVRRRRKLWGWAVGASAAVLAICVQLASVVGVLQVARQPARDAIIIVDVGPLQLTAPPNDTAKLQGPVFELASLPGEPEWGPQIDPPWELAETEPWSDLAYLISTGVDLSEDMVLAKWGVLGAPNDPEETTPELEETVIEPPRGVEPPRLRGVYDRLFLLREKESPPLAPARHPALAHSYPPLTTRTVSVDKLHRGVLRDRLLDEEDLRVEDFIAAERYEWNTAPGQIQLQSFAGPSRFSPKGAGMLQIAVGVGRATVDPEPTHWTLAVDVSSGMAWRSRLMEVRRAVARLLREMRPSDRLSLVAFREDAWIAAELVTRDQADEILDVVDGWEPRGRCDFIAGLQQGLSASLDGGFDGQRRLVVLSDGRSRWPKTVIQQVLALQERAAKLEVKLQWLELAQSDEASSVMVERLRAAGAEADQLTEARHAGSAMMEKWYGQSMLALSDARLHIRFEPKTVAFHRLVGHQASAFGGLRSLEHTIDLRRGDQASVLYEVWLNAAAPSSHVATATLQWRDPKTGEPKQRRRRITQADFALTFADAPAPLQYATLAAEAGEVLTRSIFAVNRSRTLKEVLAAQTEVRQELKQQGEFRRFVRWLEAVERVRKRRGD